MAVDLKKFDFPQVLRSVFEVEDNCLRVKVVNGTPGGGGELEVLITHTEDSVRLGNGTDFLTSTYIGPKVGLDVAVINTPLPVDISGSFPSTLDVNVISSVLPTGASTSALQTTGNASLASIDSKLTSPLTVQATDLDIRNLTFATDKVDTSGSSVSITNFPSVQIIQGNSTVLTGTANANNIDIIPSTDVSGYDTVIIHNTGTFNLSAAAQFSNDGVNWVSVLGQTLSAAGTAPTTNLNTTNTIYKVPVSGRFFRYRTTAYTSGTITANVYISVNDINDFGSRNNTISGTVTTSGTITAGNAQVTGTGAALNATPIASTVVGQYDVATLALTGTWIASLIAEGSNDGTNWFTIPVQQINNLNALPQTVIVTNGLYKIPIQFNNLRVRISAYTSGTVSANARISAIDGETLNPKQTIEAGTTTNIYNEVLSIASGVLTTIASFTATQNTKLRQVDVSGENIATFTVLVNGNVVSKKRTYFGGQLDNTFSFDNGIIFTTGQQVLVQVIHNRPTTGNFNANILLLEG